MKLIITILLLLFSLFAQAQWKQGMKVKKGQIVMNVTPWMALRDINKSTTPPSLKAKGWWAPLKADYVLGLLARIEELERKRAIIYADSAKVDLTTKPVTMTIYQTEK